MSSLRRSALCWACLAALCGIPNALDAGIQASFYVSPLGDDLNPGTYALPFKSPDRARLAVRAINASMSGDIMVYFRGGTYALPSTLQFDPADSGNHGYSVIYSAYAGECARFSGGQALGPWSSSGGGVFQASCPGLNFRQLYVDGLRGVRARQPNAGSWNHLLSYDDAASQILVDPSETAAWQNLGAVEMVIQLHWAQSRLRIASDASGVVVPQEPERSSFFSNQHPTREAGQPYYFENAREFLDQPGEWYLDQGNGILYYMPRPGEDLTCAQVTAPLREPLVTLLGSPGSQVHHIQFKGLYFEYSTWMAPSTQGWVGVQAGFDPHNQSPSAAIHLEWADHLRLENNVFRHLGGDAVALVQGVHDCTLVGNRFSDIAAAAVAVDRVLQYAPSDPAVTCTNNLILDNWIEDTGQDERGSVGLFGGYVEGLSIRHNHLARMPYSGISLGWGWTFDAVAQGGNTINFNEIGNAMQTGDDGGGIYVMSNQQPFIYIKGNYVHDVLPSPIAQGNPIAGIYLDQGCDYATVQSNVLENVWIPLFFNTGSLGPDNQLADFQSTSPKDKAKAGIEADYASLSLAAQPDWPQAKLSQPADGSTLPSGLPLQLQASATGCQFPPQRAEFYQNGIFLAGLNGPGPYAWTLANPQPGDSNFYVRCEDGQGAWSSSNQSLVHFTASSPTPSPSLSPSRSPNTATPSPSPYTPTPSATRTPAPFVTASPSPFTSLTPSNPSQAWAGNVALSVVSSVAYPNPLNQGRQIHLHFLLTGLPSSFSLKIYSISGTLVASQELQPLGQYLAGGQGAGEPSPSGYVPNSAYNVPAFLNGSGGDLANGVYIYLFSVGDGKTTVRSQGYFAVLK